MGYNSVADNTSLEEDERILKHKREEEGRIEKRKKAEDGKAGGRIIEGRKHVADDERNYRFVRG